MDYPIKPVRGNWFKLEQPLEKIVWLNSQHTIEDYVPAEGDNLKVALVGAYDHYEMEKVQIELNPDNNKRNLLTYENNGTLPLGLYDIEISVTLADGKRLHSCQPKRVKVVKTNSEASIPDSVEFGVDTYELDGAVFMYVPNGEGGGGDMSNYYTKDEADELFMPANTPIPSEVTEQTVSGWGFTKNTGTYSKPQGGIPKTDLASDVQTSLGMADNAIQKAAQGTTGLLKPDGTVDNSTYLTQHQDISGKVNTSDLSNVAFSGDYDDLDNKPIIPAAGDVNVIEKVKVNGTALTVDASDKSVNVKVPSNYPLQSQTALTVQIAPNTFNVWENAISNDLTITLGTEISGVLNEFVMQFSIAANTTPTITINGASEWAGIDTFQGGKTYQISVVNGYAIGVEFDTIVPNQ